MKKVYIGSNLKMYKDIGETAKYLEKLGELTKCIDRSNVEIFILPSYLSLEKAKSIGKKYNILIGAQNMCWENEGQFSGEISPKMLKEIGIDMVMAGHSERRHIFGEDNFTENRKVLAAMEHGFKTLLCIGETEEEKRFGISKEVLREQLLVGLNGVKSRLNLMIAYEPVWSIGVKGVPASSEYANEMHSVIKNCLYDIFNDKGLNIPVLYGGSVNEDNAVELFKQKNVDGLFVGRAAWNAEGFNNIIQKILKI